MTLNDRIGGVIMDEKKCWLVVCVQSNREKKTYERLSALGLNLFFRYRKKHVVGVTEARKCSGS